MQVNRYTALPLLVSMLLVSPAAFSSTFEQVQTEIFDGSCATSGCHATGGRSPVLSPGQSYGNIVDVQHRSGVDYIEPGKPEMSYIMSKVLGTASGGLMPPSGPLSDDKIKLLSNWIQQGAAEGSYNGRSYHMTSSDSPNLSETHIINSSAVAQEFTGNLYHKSGSPLGAANVVLHAGTIKSQGRVVLSATDLQALFDVPAWTGPAILDINGVTSFDVMSKLKRNGRVTNTNCVRSDNAQNVEGSDSLDIAYVRFINDGFTPIADIRGTLYDADGNVIGSPDALFFAELGSREAVFKSQGSISNIIGADWSGQASFVLSGTYDNLRLMNLNYVNDEIFFNFSCYVRGTNQNAATGAVGLSDLGSLGAY